MGDGEDTAAVGGGTSGARVVALGAELRALHDRIREVLDDALDATDLSPTEWLRHAASGVANDPVARCRTFCAVLTAHHETEDARLFPWLLREHPELADVVERLEQDHAMIATLLTNLSEAVDGGSGPDVLVRHLEGLDAIMESHFRFEERALVAVLDAVPPEASGPDLDEGFWRPRVRG